MALQTVDIVVEDSQTVPQPVEGVAVRIFLANDITLVTESLTDATGKASFTLDDVNPTYLVRFYKLGVAILQPQSILMQAPFPITFDVTAQTFAQPTAPDPAMCRVSGHLRNVVGNVPLPLRIKLEPVRNPAIQQLSPPYLTTRLDEDIISDDEGYVSFDVFRGSVLEALVPGWVDEPIVVEVPDQASLDLVDFLLPTAAVVEAGPDDVIPVTVGVGDSVLLYPRLKLSNNIYFCDNQMLYEDAQLGATSDDDSIAEVEEVTTPSGPLRISGVALGTTNVTITPINVDNYFAKRIPAYPTQPLVVQVFVVI